MKNENCIELCIHCEEIDVAGQTVFCRTDHRNCPKCGNNEYILIHVEQELCSKKQK